MELHNPKCFANHMGPWMIEPNWFKTTVEAIKSGTIQARTPAEDRELYSVLGESVAVISIAGPISKGVSKYTETSSVMTRVAIRSAVQDQDVKGILLHIDSPGGMVAGTMELANEVRTAAKSMPIHAHIDDLGASAAYWVASQAQMITANAMAEVGSIGTVAVVEDTSGAAEMAGVKVHVISTGDYKGAFADGVPVTDAQLDDLQGRVNDMNAYFKKDIVSGRDLSTEAVDKIATGQVWIAAKAIKAGLIDSIMPFESAMALLMQVIDNNEKKTQNRGLSRNAKAESLLKLKKMD